MGKAGFIINGAEIMKIIKTTNIISTKGTTLISEIDSSL
jgi:hypothetical protein